MNNNYVIFPATFTNVNMQDKMYIKVFNMKIFVESYNRSVTESGVPFVENNVFPYNMEMRFRKTSVRLLSTPYMKTCSEYGK